MKKLFTRMLAAMALISFAGWAHGAITCSVASPGFTAYYLPTNPIDITQTSVTVTCNRALLSDAASVTYFVAVNNGMNAGGGFNRAVRPGGGGANRINYDTYRDSACATIWSVLANRITGTINFAGTGVMMQTRSWWGCVPAAQVGKNAGTFSDTVTMTLTAAGTTIVGAPFTFPVTIIHPATCNIGPVPGDVVFNYTSFAAAPVVAGTTFGLNCTNGMPYTMALDAYAGTILGLNYTLTLNSGVLGGNGTGLAVVIPIDGTMAAGQSGTCSATPPATCNASQARTLTITY